MRDKEREGVNTYVRIKRGKEGFTQTLSCLHVRIFMWKIKTRVEHTGVSVNSWRFFFFFELEARLNGIKSIRGSQRKNCVKLVI